MTLDIVHSFTRPNTLERINHIFCASINHCLLFVCVGGGNDDGSFGAQQSVDYSITYFKTHTDLPWSRCQFDCL